MARTRYATPNASTSLRSLPAAALRAVLREGYTAADLKHDALAGLVVGTIALPLAMALAIAVGVPPQHGLYTAIVAGAVVAALGGSRTQVTGPTAAFIVILAPIHATFGLAGLLVSGLMAGVMLIGMAVARLGKLIQYIPYPVTTGFTAGIGTVIAVLQLEDLLGLELARKPQHFLERVGVMLEAVPTASGWELGVGLGTLAVLLAWPRITKSIPAPLVALPMAAIAVTALNHAYPGIHIDTIATRFSAVVDGVTVRGVPPVPPMPLWPWSPSPAMATVPLSLDVLRALVPGAFAIAMLGAIESLLSAVVADGMARTRHDPDAELLALGIGNVITPFFGGVPATGAIARTATNIRSGARSPLAAVVHALTVLVAMLALAPLLGYLPMTSLAALLLLVAWNMSDAKHVAHIVRVAPRSDVLVLLTCYGLTVAIDMVAGVTAGVVLAAFLFMRRMAEVTQTRLASEARTALPDGAPEGVELYEISGPLFFGAAQKAMAALNVTSPGTKAVVLLMGSVHAMDATGLVALESALEQLVKHRGTAILTAVQPQPMALLERAKLHQRAGVLIRPNLAEALETARALVRGEPA